MSARVINSALGPLARTVLPAQRVLKFISYNILAPRYSSYNSYCPQQYLDWAYRAPRVLADLDRHAADIVALQECDAAFYEGELSEWMAGRGMEGVFLAREVGPVAAPLEGIALLWRAPLLEAVATRSALYAALGPAELGLGPEVGDTAPWVRLRSLGEGAVMALLRHRPTGQLLLAACTHLFWNPAYPDVKVLQAALLCAQLRSFGQQQQQAAATPDTAALASPPAPTGSVQPASVPSAPSAVQVPVLLGGDFNSLASKRLPDRFDPQIVPGGEMVSGVYTLLSRGSLPPGHPDHPHTRVWEEPAAARGGGGGGTGAGDAGRFPAVELNTSGLQLCSLSAEAFGREPPVTNRTAGWAGCLDYVWLTRGSLAVTSALAMPYNDGGAPPLGPGSAQGGPGSEAGGPEEQAAQQWEREEVGGGAGGVAAGAGGGGGVGDVAPWRDPLADVAFGAIPDADYPSDHLPVGGQVVLLAGA